MPRHPPCALKNLTTKDQGVIFERTMKPSPHPERHGTRSRFIFLEIASYKRCSRPLCSSQTTTPDHTPHTPKQCMFAAAGKPETQAPHPAPRTLPKGRERGPRAVVLLSQDPTVCQTLNRRYPRRTVPGPLSREDPYWVPQETQRPLFVDIPPVSTRRRTNVCATGVTPDKPATLTYMRRGVCRCSLERR